MRSLTLSAVALSILVAGFSGAYAQVRTTPAGKLQLHLLAAIAEFERARIVERVRAGLARAKTQGRRLGRRPHRIADHDLERTIRGGTPWLGLTLLQRDQDALDVLCIVQGDFIENRDSLLDARAFGSRSGCGTLEVGRGDTSGRLGRLERRARCDS